jgi:hypothetical protein
MNQAGVDVARLTIPHSLDGFVQLEAARRKLGLMPEECTFGLETAHNLIIEFLWSQSYQQVYVIPPSVVKSNRNRFPTPASVQALAGTCPVTDKSGKRKVIKFRKACDREWRSLSQAWAIALVNRAKSPLAIAYFEQIRPHCHNRHHAYRCVANRWLAIVWKLWQDQQPYDEVFHFQQRAARSKPKI